MGVADALQDAAGEEEGDGGHHPEEEDLEIGAALGHRQGVAPMSRKRSSRRTSPPAASNTASTAAISRAWPISRVITI